MILNQVLSRTRFQSTFTISGTSSNSTLFIDLACSNYMTFDPLKYSTKSHSFNIPKIHTANGSTLQVSHINSISTSNLTVPDLYLLPQLSLNLPFVGQICDLGHHVHFSPTGYIL